MADGGRVRRPKLAETADRHKYYEASVQNVEAECEFVRDTFRALQGRTPRSFREDFCGTAGLACHWVRQGRNHTAIGVDLDPAVLEWGQRHHVASLAPGQRRRLEIIQSDVTTVKTRPVDVVGAFNFSYWVFKERQQMRRYFRRVRDALVDDGLFFLDAYGGYDAYRELREATDHGSFQYIWDQARYHPVTGEILCHIHFRFADGSRMDKAFTYDWRLWSLPELGEILREAGFGDVVVYWEGSDEDGSGNGIFSPEPRGDADAGWVAYIVARK